MMLYEEGKFLLKDPVSKYIPEFKNQQVLDKFNPADSTYTTVPAKRDITIHDLLTHFPLLTLSLEFVSLLAVIFIHFGNQTFTNTIYCISLFLS
jgi:hypothetical protein